MTALGVRLRGMLPALFGKTAAGDASPDMSAAYAASLRRLARKEVSRFRKHAGGVTPRTCPLCGYRGRFAAFGSPPRYDARCPKCGALERQRLLALLIERRGVFGPKHAVLHFAPEACLSRKIKAAVGRYETADITASRRPTHRIDIENTGLADASYDRIVCNHVLEHVDDRKALAEMYRMLKPGGLALLTTPVVEGWSKTYENPAVASEADRVLHFGQRDHVRMFGRDIRDRIRAAGFELEDFVAVEPDVLTYGLWRGETIFMAWKPKAGADAL